MKILVVFCFFIAFSFCQDPADSWLAYAVAGNGRMVTEVSAKVTVPENPKHNGSYPAFWFGVGEQNAIIKRNFFF